MKKIIGIFFLIYSSFVFSQDVQILEDYMYGRYSQNQVSRLKVTKEEFQRKIAAFMEDYEIFIEQNLFDNVKSQFDFSKPVITNSDTHNFSFKTNKKKFRKRRFSDPLLSKDGNFAIICEKESCRQGFCGGGALVLMEKMNGKWKVKKTLYAWIN